MVKRKNRVILALIEESTPSGNADPLIRSRVAAEVSLSRRAQRVCTPSPPSSPGSKASHCRKSPPVVSEPPIPSMEAEMSSPFPKLAKKSCFRGSWHPSSHELVVPELDIFLTPKYDVLLFSQVVMMSTKHASSFRCRHCKGSVIFPCQSASSASNHVPCVENHLLTCTDSPIWLRQEIWRNSRNGGTKMMHECSKLIWNRMKAHHSYQQSQSRKIRFALNHEERIIPSCNKGRACRR